jgi:hypothetical protein
MTTPILPQDPTVILADVESFFDSLPEKRRGRRTRAEIDAPVDITPELENYGEPPAPTIAIELDADALEELPKLLYQLAKSRSDAASAIIAGRIYALLGLELE